MLNPLWNLENDRFLWNLPFDYCKISWGLKKCQSIFVRLTWPPPPPHPSRKFLDPRMYFELVARCLNKRKSMYSFGNNRRLLHSQSQRFFANVSLIFSNSNNRRVTFAHVAILLSSTQRVAGYLMALKYFDFSCSLEYKQPTTSKKYWRHLDEMNFTRGLKLRNLILSFLVFSRSNIGSIKCAHYGRYWYSVTFF